MSGWDAFNKYVGVQGILAILLVGGYVGSFYVHVQLTDAYSQIMTLVLGYYFAKNGVGAIEQLLKALKVTFSTAPKKG